MSPESAAAFSRQSIRAIYRGVESGQVHYVERPEGVVVCLTSLTDNRMARRNEGEDGRGQGDAPAMRRVELDLKG